MTWTVRIIKMGLCGLVGLVAGVLGSLLLATLPPSVTRGEAPRPRIAVLVDVSAPPPKGGAGLGGALQSTLTEMRPAMRAATAYVASLPDPRDATVIAFDSTARNVAVDRLQAESPNQPQDGALAQALAWAERDLSGKVGPKLAIIWLDRTSLGANDIAKAKALAKLKWEIRVYGTVITDPEAMRSVASDIHFAFREPKPGLQKALKLAQLDLPKRLKVLSDEFGDHRPLSKQGVEIVRAMLSFLLPFALAIFQGIYYRKPIERSLLRGFVIAVFAGALGWLFTALNLPTGVWAGSVGLATAIALATGAPNPRWFALLIGSAECAVLIGLLHLPIEMAWAGAVFGLGIGLSIGFSEEVTRRRFLIIEHGKAHRIANLGRREVSFGSSPDCAYVLPDGNARIAAVRVGPDGPYRVDTLTGRSRSLHPGESQRVGMISITAFGPWGKKVAPSTGGHAEGPLVLRVGETLIELSEGTQFTAAELPVARGSIAGVVGEVSANPAQPDVLGLTNRSGAYWFATLPTGVQTPIPPGRTVRLAPGTNISFGGGEGSVEVAPTPKPPKTAELPIAEATPGDPD